MNIYAIADLHLSFHNPKPMHVFGNNWENHAEKIKKDWEEKVKQEDLVLLPGDFSWETYLEDTYEDFSFLNQLPGKKLLLKGNHDYWWTTLASMRKYLKENRFETIDFIYNNSYEYNGYVITGTRGWNLSSEDKKIFEREVGRLKLSLENGITKYGTDSKIITCLHYPPITKNTMITKENWDFLKIMKQYCVEKCIYGHLHSKAHMEAVEGTICGIEFQLVSADYLNFKLQKIV